MLGKAHSGQEGLEIQRSAAWAVATAPVGIFAHSLIAPLGPGSLHHLVARQPKQHLHQETNKPIRSLRGEMLPGWPPRWKESFLDPLNTMAAGISRRVAGSQGIQHLPVFDG